MPLRPLLAADQQLRAVRVSFPEHFELLSLPNDAIVPAGVRTLLTLLRTP